MRPDKPQFWTGGGEGAGVNLAITEMTNPGLWTPIANLTARTLVDVNIDCREMMQTKLNIIQDGTVMGIINNPIQKNIIVAPSQSLSFEAIRIGAHNILTATFSRIVFNVTSQDTTPRAMMYNNNGTRLYVLGGANNNIFEYNLTTAYDIATATFSRIALNVSPQDTIPAAMMYNNNGTRLYVLGSTNDNIFEYNLTTAYDIATATFSRIALDVSPQDTIPAAMMYNNNGTRLYVLGGANDNIFEYNLTTAYDIATATFSRIALNVSPQDTVPLAMMYNNNGTRLYVLGGDNDNIFEYNLTTAYNIATANFLRIALNVTLQDNFPRAMMYNNNGTRLYVLGASTHNIFEYAIGDFGNVKIRTINN